jgi:biopolymer transport protein TolQ
MTTDMSFLGMVLGASVIVQGVMVLLLMASVASWAIILRKRSLLKTAGINSDAFEGTFWSGGDLTGIYREITGSGEAPSDMAGIFEAGFREFRRLTRQPGIEPDRVLDGARRSMRVAQLRETDRLEEHLATLATIGSTSPYVGLFGTVWGIMNSFRGLANVDAATLAMVAPGIAEALIATAMGLFAAIPAVIAYNAYADKVGRLEVRYDSFAEEFQTILQRYAHTQQGGAKS